MVVTSDYKKVDKIMHDNGYEKASLIAVLQEIQSSYSFLPEELLEHVSKKMEISPSKIFSVATFYENFSLNPKGKYIIKICDGTACHVRKSIPILDALRKFLGLDANKHTTDDMLFTLETVSCLGACGLAPVITINDKVYAKMTPETALDVLKSLQEESK